MDSKQCTLRPDGVWVCNLCGFTYDLSWPKASNRLSKAPDGFEKIMKAIPPAKLDTPLWKGGWSPRQYAAHLVDWAEIINARIELILREDSPVIQPHDQDALASERKYETWLTAAMIRRYRKAIGDVIKRVDFGGGGGWDRVGIRPDGIGPSPLSTFVCDLVHEYDHHSQDITGAPWRKR